MKYRFGHLLLFLTTFAMAFAAVPATKAPAKKGPVKKAAVGKATTTKQATAKKGSRQKAAPAAFRNRQLQPTQDRYREIQQALTEKGYLKSEPNGVWDADSMAALRQFQVDKNLSPTGKLSSQSLIGLGWGPKTAGPLVMPPPGEAATVAPPVVPSERP